MSKYIIVGMVTRLKARDQGIVVSFVTGEKISHLQSIQIGHGAQLAS